MSNTLKIHCTKCTSVQKATVNGTTIYTNCVDSHIECLTCGTVHTVSYAVSMSAIIPDAKQERLLLEDEQPENIANKALAWSLEDHHPSEVI